MINTIVTNVVEDYNEDDEFGDCAVTPQMLREKAGIEETALEDDEFGDCAVTPQMLREKAGIEETALEDDEFGDCAVTPQMLREKTEKHIVIESSNSNDNSPKLFAPLPVNNQWWIDRDEMFTINEVQTGDDIHLPYVDDTEFDSFLNGKLEQRKRTKICLQVKGIDTNAPSIIFVDENLKSIINSHRIGQKTKPFYPLKTEFFAVDYLNRCGINAYIKPIKSKEETIGIPKCFVTCIGHFLTAEINFLGKGRVKENIKQLQRNSEGKRIETARRIRCVTPVRKQELDYVELDFLIVINGVEYILCLRLIDTGAIHGVASYDAFCKASGHELKYKDNFTKDEKSRMFDMCLRRCQEFGDYALGDLEVYEALDLYNEKWQEVYQLLGLEDYYQIPKLTIGGSVKDLFCAALAKKLDIPTENWKKIFKKFADKYLYEQSAGSLRQFSRHTRALLAKVEGGRCRNNRPTDVFVARKVNGKYDAVLINDIDISGCYGEGQRNQDYFIGNPEIYDFKVSKNNEYLSLRKWLESYDVHIEKLIQAVDNRDYKEWNNPKNWGELVKGAWYGRFSSDGRLEYPQDFFASWFTNSGNGVNVMAKFINQMECDTEQLVTDWVDFNEEEGNLKIFNHEIHNAVLTHDGLEWIFAIASKRQRQEFLDKTIMLSSSVYPRSQRILSEPKSALKQLDKQHENWQLRNTMERIDRGDGVKSWRHHDKECHAWFSVNLGKLLIDDLLIQRKKAQKTHGKKSPLDVLFKLCVNTLYGDMVSKFFVTANTIVGNNITARARLLCWCMEKGLHGWQSITDGCGFEPTGVLHPGRDNIDGECVNLHRKDSKLNRWKVKRGNLGNVKEIKGIAVEFKSWDKDKNEPILMSSVGLEITHQDDRIETLLPVLKPNKDNSNYQDLDYNPATNWIDKQAMKHLSDVFPMVSVLHSDTTELKVNDDLSVSLKDRKGQFSFETKDIFVEGGFHGSANYLLRKPHETNVKARGYETKRKHISVDWGDDWQDTELIETDEYGDKTNPAKNLLNQIVTNPANIKRQKVAVKQGILKSGDYRNLAAKYESIGLETGDTILKALLMQEFSLSQFTFETYEQYEKWAKLITKYKLNYKQSLETFFLNEDGTLDYVKMSNTVDEMISKGVVNPIKALDKNRHKNRDNELYHPEFDVFCEITNKLNGFFEE
ncbi:MAG: hypothetical protein AAF378_21300 [Cyanobacteria bacterium P01_A01_bin.84]